MTYLIFRRHPTSLYHYYFIAVVFKKAFMSKYLTCVFCIARFKWSLHILYSYTILFQFILLKCLKSIVPQGFPELFFGFQIQIAPVTIYSYYIPYSSFSISLLFYCTYIQKSYLYICKLLTILRVFYFEATVRFFCLSYHIVLSLLIKHFLLFH